MEQPRTGTRYGHLCVLVILIVYFPIGSVLSEDGSLTIGIVLLIFLLIAIIINTKFVPYTCNLFFT